MFYPLGIGILPIFAIINCLHFLNLTPPTNDYDSIISYVDAAREAVDAVEAAGLEPQNIFFNIVRILWYDYSCKNANLDF